MHILVTTDSLGGVWTYTRELVTGLISQGDRVTLVSFGNIPTAAQTRWMEKLPNLDFHPTAFKLEWMLDSAGDMAASAEYLESVVNETRPDLLHFSQYFYGDLRCDVPRIVVAHSDVMSWWMAVHQTAPPETEWSRWYRTVVARGLKAATMVVAPSQWMMDQVDLYYGRSESRMVIHNGRTPGLFNPYLGKTETIVTVGRLWDSGKNAALLLREKMPAPVRIIGSDQHPEQRQSVLAAEELQPNIQLDPEQGEQELAQIFAHTGIYAATSQYEPFGLAPLEAALSRCAIVASDIPSFRELWDGAAVFFRNNDSGSLCHALARLVHAPNLRCLQAGLAYRRAKELFTADRMVRAYRDLYMSMLPATALTA